MINYLISFKKIAHNRLDLIATIVTAVTIILGLFLWENDFEYLFGIGLALIST